MSRDETSTDACADARPETRAEQTNSHPMDQVLQRIFNDPRITLKRELAWTTAALERYRAANAHRLPELGEGADEEDDGDGASDMDTDVDASTVAAPDGAASAVPRARQADRLVALAESVELFHTPENEVFGDFAIDGRRETWALRSKGFRRWLTRRFFEAHRSVPSSQALEAAVGVLEATTLGGTGSPERALHVRVGSAAGKLYLDLGDADWRAIEIDEAGWRVVSAPPLRFRRPARQRALPVPEPGGSVDRLRAFLNLRSDHDLVTVVTWALAALRDRGPYPILVLTGEQGSAKSTCTAMLQALIDPTAMPSGALPREEGELIAAGREAHLLAFDNLSVVPPPSADALCRLAGRQGIARPVILNGIADLVVRPDLADRALVVTLPAVRSGERRSEAELWSAFDAERPRLLGVLLTAMAEGLRRAREVRPPDLPRLADFALWATACETALWPAGTFRAMFEANHRAAAFDALEADPLSSAVLTFLETREMWSGTATTLMRELKAVAGDAVVRGRSWPGNPRVLAGRVRQLSAFLRTLGLEVSFERDTASRARLIRLEMETSAWLAAVRRDPPSPQARTQDDVPNATTTASGAGATGLTH